MMDISNFDFYLPKNLIASRPVTPRSSSRLLFYKKSKIRDLKFSNLPEILKKDDLLVFNDTKVLPALLYGYVRNLENITIKEKKIEFLLVKQTDLKEWFCICRPLKKINTGDIIYFSNLILGKVLKKEINGVIIKFEYDGNFFEHLTKIGFMPLPPYIRKIREVDILDSRDYQSIFSNKMGSIASPTASLHFDNALLGRLKEKGIKFCFVTLHVGIGTFSPLRTLNIMDHKMHSEYGEITKKTAHIINSSIKNGGRVIPVGTTCLRILESAIYENTKIKPFKGYTNIYITPGFQFKISSGLITNFHLPKSSLFILIASIIGLENAQKIYSHAISRKYRFFSYGDGSILLK